MTYEIRLATAKDLSAVLQWLKEEEDAYNDGVSIERGFYCNRNVVSDAQENNALFVALDGDHPIAFAALSSAMDEINILEVQPGRRREGAGRTLATHCIEHYRNAGNGACVVTVECTPETSEPFWKSLGFKLFPPRFQTGGALGIYEIEHRYENHPDWEPVEVVIRVFRERALYERENVIPPIMEIRPNAARDGDGAIQLGKRIIFYRDLLGFEPREDVAIELIINGESKFKEKAKYDISRDYGVQFCNRSGAHFLETIPGD